jgi:tetratricopeptide (TPR) repeat protein
MSKVYDELKESIFKQNAELEKITRNESPKNYAVAQFKIGQNYKQISMPERACEHLNNIKVSDDEVIFYSAQYNLGSIYFHNKEYTNAINFWEKTPTNYPFFNKTQLYLSQAYEMIGNFRKSRMILEELQEDNSPYYTNAQFNLGVYYYSIHDFDKAIEKFLSISEEYEEFYCKARFNLGRLYYEKEDFEKSVEYWEQIQPIYDEYYSTAQFSLGKIYYEELNNPIKAIECYKNVDTLDSHFPLAQFEIGRIIIENNLKKENSEKAFQNALSNPSLKYNIDIYKEIISLSQFDPHLPKLELFKLVSLVDYILNLLVVDFDYSLIGEVFPERKIAHYTKLDVVNLLIGESKKFRLNTIQNVNDPTEGKILEKFLNNNELDLEETFNDEEQAFISCFTFVHDSLNQFRLYGKSENKEASGVSLVFNKGFFNENDLDIYSFVPSKQYTNENNLPKEKTDKNMSTQESVKNSHDANKLLLYRCIYMDAKSGFIKLAQRDEITFYRKIFYNRVIKDSSHHQELYESASELWKIYSFYLSTRQKNEKVC